MARSKGPCHSLMIKLGHAQKSENLMRKQLVDQQDRYTKHEQTLRHAQIEALRQLRDAHNHETAALKSQMTDTCALRDMVVAYDDLYGAIMSDAHTRNVSTMKCLQMLRNSLWEAATGLGVKRI